MSRFNQALIQFVSFIVLLLSASLLQAANRAYDKPAPTVRPELTELSKTFEQKVYKVSDSVYLAVGYSLANVGMIVGTDGIVIVDTAEDVESGKKILAEFRKITDKPVKAIVYTHSHIDHFGGVAAFTNKEDVTSGKVKIFSQSSFMENLKKEPGVLAYLVGNRNDYWTGKHLEVGPKGYVNMGCCSAFSYGERSFFVPTDTFDDKLKTEVAGIQLELLYIPSETPDELAVWVPKDRVMFTADSLLGESFPNLYTIRGHQMRDPFQWYGSMARMASYNPEHLAPAHGRPESGKRAVEVLLNYRDGIQYVLDQSFRYMNKGYTPEELIEVIKLPASLAKEPWLQEMYGSLNASIRGFYSAYIGWFEGDPWTLSPLPLKQRAANYVALMGGRDKVMQAAGKAIQDKQYTWAAELLSYLIRLDINDMEARDLKADAYTRWAYGLKTATWRDWALTSAKELRGELPPGVMDSNTYPLSGDLQSFYKDSANFLRGMRMRLKGEECSDVRQTVGIAVKDTGEKFTLELRNGIAIISKGIESDISDILELNQSELIRLTARTEPVDKVLDTQSVSIKGGRKLLETTFSCFEPRFQGRVPVALPTPIGD